MTKLHQTVPKPGERDGAEPKCFIPLALTIQPEHWPTDRLQPSEFKITQHADTLFIIYNIQS